MKKCELCSSVARMYCESDQASLCWDCDSRVHTANFLVAKHVRTLLCHACQSPTPWTGSGPRLGPTVSVCPSCVSTSDPSRRNVNTEDGLSRHDEDEDGDREEDDEEEEDDDHEDDDDDDDENQVVPLSSLPPSFASNSSTSGESSESRDRVSGSSFGSFNQPTSSSESTRYSYGVCFLATS